MVKFRQTNNSINPTEYEVVKTLNTDRDLHLGYVIKTGSVWMFRPASTMIYGHDVLHSIATELAKLNGTTLS